MPFTIVRNDIARMAVDAVVTSTVPGMPIGGADAAIHRAAGPELRQACRQLQTLGPDCPAITPGFSLPSRYVIHTVSPAWQGGHRGEEERLHACYTAAMALAEARGLHSVAFPLLSAGLLAFPAQQAMRIAMDAIRSYVLEHDLMVYLVLYDRESVLVGRELAGRLRRYIDDRYVQQHEDDVGLPPVCGALPPAPQQEVLSECAALPEYTAQSEDEAPPKAAAFGVAADRQARRLLAAAPSPAAGQAPTGLEAEQEEALRRFLNRQDESFTQRLLRLIDESGLSDPECYRRANIDRRLFSKIRSNLHYQPSKPTVLALAFALQLTRPQTDELLRSAGLALNRSSYFDLIVAFFLEQGIYDVAEINQALYSFDQPLLGAQ